MFPIIFLCNTVIIFLGGLVMYHVVAATVSIQRRWLYIWSTALANTLIWVVNQYLLPNGSSVMDLLNCVYSVASTALFASRGHKWQGVVTVAVLLAVQVGFMFALGYVAFPIAQKLGYPSTELFNNTTSFGSAIMCFIMLCLLVPLDYLLGRLMTRLFRGSDFFPVLLCFLPIPVSQGILMNIINRVLPIVHDVDDIIFSYTLAILLAVAADVVFFVGAKKPRQASQLREQVRIVSQQLDVQTGYYRQLQENILTVNQIRHDLNNQLQAAYRLMESGEMALARCQLDQVQESLRQQVGSRFSNNLMVDAVLQNKAKSCQDNGISLAVNTEIPSELPVENAHLCSVFSNLLDNSIRGIQESGVTEKEISLRAAVRNSCLIIRCSNPACKPQKTQNRDSLRLHGLGLEILSKIASEYNGYLKTEYQDGWYHASVCLPLSRTSEGDHTYAR